MTPSDPSSHIKIIRGKIPPSYAKEHKEKMNYDNPGVDEEVKNCRGPFQEPWLNAVHQHEPASMPGFERITGIKLFRDRIRGKVLDVGAGTCWLSAKLSLLPEVEEVYALDLSENFLSRVGTRVLKSLSADMKKISFLISDFNDIPLEEGVLDCAFLFASLHHSLSPIKTLQEISRCLKRTGSIFVFENPPSVLNIRKTRERTLAISEKVTEICYTRDELIYLMKAAQIGEVKTYPLDILSRPGWRLLIRKVLRRFDIEHLFLNPPTYLFHIEKK